MKSYHFNNDLYIRPLFPGIGEAVARRTFLRDNETWGDVATRVALGNSLLHSSGRTDLLGLEKHIASGLLLMSGRHLQHGDVTQPGRNLEVFSNCSSAATSSMKFYLLLNGSGVGRCYDDDIMIIDWSKLPNVDLILNSNHSDFQDGTFIKSEIDKVSQIYDEYHKVADSREGWGKAVELLEYLAFRGWSELDVALDFSEVRAKGMPIKGMQNRPSAGPVPTMKAIHSILEMSKKARTNPEEWPLWKQNLYVDHYLADCVHLGGARRAARIAVKYWRDKGILEYCRIKRDGGLWSANMSVGVDQDYYDILNNPSHPEHQWAMSVANAVVDGQVHDKTGEPGIVNLHKLTSEEEGLLETVDNIGSNSYPLTSNLRIMYKEISNRLSAKKWKFITNPCIPGWSKLFTKNGEVNVKDVEIGTEIWTGKRWTKIVKKTNNGIKEIFRYETDAGYFDSTPNHRIVQNGQKIEIQYAHSIDCIVGSYCESLEIKNSQFLCSTDVYDITVDDPEHVYWCNGFLSSNCGEIVLSILGGFCVIADVALACAKTLNYIQEDLKMLQNDQKHLSIWQNYNPRMYWLDTVRAEIIDAVKHAVRALIRTNLLPSVYNGEVKRTNRIGVSLTGIHEFAWIAYGYGFKDLLNEEYSKPFWDFINYLRTIVSEEAKRYSEELGVVCPHTDTTIKPSGSVSKLFGLTEGGHLPSMRYYLRWVQFQKEDPLAADYEAAGYPCLKDLNGYEHVVIVGFPTAPYISTLGMEDKLVTATEASPIEQFMWLRLLEKYWIVGVDDNNVPLKDKGNQISYTLKFDPNVTDRNTFFDVLWSNQNTVKCCSVMPQTDMTAYAYQPEQPVDKDTYDSIVSKITSLQETITLDALQCASGACPI